ncbi:hypothetical protein Pla22_27420 [Rubripirellula amarantea]|uniref:Translational regulator CsrA n=1 Tax=Rubripirellula amarantea TaxID=2527999 RepID=A0A5C5WWW7_9BACT|nr:carbon storage regulator [Rubripirellula amarantea]TWT55088.1 hypothetical protein Pla22_27420 [Rubripirellula amarantea]
MLVLTRKADEQILIGDNIKITLVRIKGGQVRIGIEAPREVRVIRGELQSHDVASESEAEYSAIDPVAEVFAHPESLKVTAKKAEKSVNRVAAKSVEAATKAELFVGTVSRNGDNVKLKRAPLSGYVAAS